MKKNIMYQDLYRYSGKSDFISFIKFFFLNPGFKFTFYLRKINSSNRVVRIFYKLFYRRMMKKYHFQIPYQTVIKEGFYIGHFGRIIVNHRVVIGKNVNISTGVTIGQSNRGKKEGTPIIGNEVWIGTNAVIVGKIKIGNNVLIAPNSYVNFDVPDNSVVIGNPAVVHHKENAIEGYVCFRV